MARKRAPGAGRKPKGEFAGKSATITTRIRPDTRSALEAAADAHGRSLSQEVEFRLRASLRKPTSEQRRNQALAHAVTLLVEVIEQDTGRSWLDDPFTGLALRHAVQLVAYHFASMSTEGAPEIPTAITEAAFKMPPDFAERYRTPEGFGSLKAFGLINEIEHAALPQKIPNEWSLPIFFSAPEAVLGQIGRDLGLNPKKKSRR